MLMEIRKIFSKKRIIFLVLFIAMVFVGNRINFSAVVGAKNQYFTLFQFFGPIAGSFLGSIFGVVAVLFAELADFFLHPVGRQVWFYSLYWTIPIIVMVLPKKYSSNVLLKSLGATFTAHSVGGAAWIWAVPMTAEQWIMLIPVTAYERLLFAAGVAGSYVVLNTVMDKLIERFKWSIPSDVLHLDKGY